MKGSLVGLFFVLALGVSVAVGLDVWGAVYTSDAGWKVIPFDEFTGQEAAWASYRNTMNVTGWSVFNVSTSPSASNDDQAYAAGYLEGSLLSTDIFNAWASYALPFYNVSDASAMNISAGIPFPKEVSSFIQDNTNWVQATAYSYMTNPTASPQDVAYWTQVHLVIKQLQGITDGYNNASSSSMYLSFWDLVAWQLQDEIGDIYATVAPSNSVPMPASARSLAEKLILRDHCSVLVKPVNNSMLFASHVTWSGYSSMLRTYKHYNMSFTGISNIPQISLSSEPGFIPSGDDFFITGANLVVMETTNDIFNQSLYFDYTTVKTIPYWIRVMVANRLATSGSEWVGNFSLYNSGTYNNQWIVVDNKLFTPGQPLQPNTLWIAEQIPGFVVSQDQTQHLIDHGYWPSYNIPFYDFIYNISGYPAMFKQYGNSMSYSLCPRAQIFARDQGKVEDFADFVNLMRSNNWQTDPLSLGSPCNAISSRCDLDPNNPGQAFGAIDCKATDNTQSPFLQSQALSGPTTETLPPFSWTEEFDATPHIGQPYTFNFGWETMSPTH